MRITSGRTLPFPLTMTGGLCLVLVALFVAIDGPSAKVVDIAVPVTVTIAFVAAGLVAWARRPHNRSGPLMVATGLSFLAAGLDAASVPALHEVGVLLDSLPLAMVLHVVMAFPSGRVPERSGRVVVAAGYVVAIGLGLPAVPIGVQAGAGIALLGVATALLVRRARRAGPVLRSALGPILGYAPAMLLVVIVAAVVIDVSETPPAGSDLLLQRAAPTTVAAAVQVIAVLGFPLVFLIGLTRGAFARAGEVAELLSQAENVRTDPSALRATLANAVGDPSVNVWYSRRPPVTPPADSERSSSGSTSPDLVDLQGGPFEELSGSRAVKLVNLDGGVVGAFTYDRSLVADDGLIDELAELTALLIDHHRIAADLRARVRDLDERDAELRAAQQRIVRAGDEERRRIARDLHDGAQQRIVALGLQAQRIARQAPVGSAVAHDASELAEGAVAVVDELRALIAGIMPVVLEERGLEPAARSLAARAPIAVDVEAQGLDGRLNPQVETTAYFVVAESVTNAIKHAGVDRADVALRREADVLVVDVRDRGRGGADPAIGSGLSGLADRVRALGGTLQVGDMPGGGVEVHAEIPCAS